MSSILKALKKLDENNVQPADELSTISRIDTKKAINKRARGVIRLNRALSALLGVLFLGGCLWIFMTYKGMFKAPPPTQKSLSGPVPEEVVEAPQTIKKTKKETGKQVLKKKAVPPKPRTRIQPQPVKKDPSPPPAPKKRRPQRPETQEGLKKLAGMKNPVPLKKPKKQISIDDSQFKLEAIIWSNNPESRFAVINGQIIRKGQSIEGHAVTHIDRDYVALKSGPAEGKVKFRVE